MTDLPYPIDDTRTHWEGCYRTPRHHNCAVVEVDRLRAENKRLRKALEKVERKTGEVEWREWTDQDTAEVNRIAREALEDPDE